MAKKPKVNPELAGVASHAEMNVEPEIVTETIPEIQSEMVAKTMTETTVVVEDELNRFKFALSSMSTEFIHSLQDAIQDEMKKRRRLNIDKIASLFNELLWEEQQLFLETIGVATVSQQHLVNVTDEKPKKEKDKFRMYQNFPSDENPQFKVAPLVNLDLKEIFTGGNPQNKSWLANLPLEERYEQFGTMKKLAENSDFLYELMNVPKAVFKCEEGNWVDCCLN